MPAQAAPLKQGLTCAESVCGAAGVATGVGGELTMGEYPETDPPWGMSLYSLHSVGFSCHWLLCLQDQQPLPSPQAAPLSLLCYLGTRKEKAIFLEPRGEEGSS